MKSDASSTQKSPAEADSFLRKEASAYPERNWSDVCRPTIIPDSEIFKPSGVHLVEVGAGIGAFSELILTQHVCKTLSLVEPSDSMYEQLRIHLRQLGSGVTVDMYHATFLAAADLIRSEQAPDSIIYVNVLEHIADDEGELEAVRRTLSASGRVLIFVPALKWLFSAFDERVATSALQSLN